MCFSWGEEARTNGYALSNFEIRCDVTCGRLYASMQVTLKHMFYYDSTYYAHFMVTRLKYTMTSPLVLKLDKVYIKLPLHDPFPPNPV